MALTSSLIISLATCPKLLKAMRLFIVASFLVMAAVAAEKTSSREGRAFPSGMLFRSRMDSPVSPKVDGMITPFFRQGHRQRNFR